jgi:DNA recombination protein RmuC
MPTWTAYAQIALLAIAVILLLWIALRRDATQDLERNLRADVQDNARATRQELTATLATFQQTLLAQSSDVARTQNEQIDSFRTQLASMQQRVSDDTRAAREAQDAALHRFGTAQAEQLRALTEANDKRLAQIQTDNAAKLDQMRATVDEKLSATLEQRLGESFKQVAERLEQVHKGLGEMQTLARDVGSLQRVLTNVKTRGSFGEVQLAALLADVFTPDQYAKNVATVPGSNERVEFAIRLPGRGEAAVPVWLPIDAKFPREDYERLLEAQERADKDGVEASSRAIEQRLRIEARTIREKYIAAPHTTDFGMLFVPTEGLYAEALRRPGLVEALQREHKVVLAGPTTLLAILNSLQMGFRTIAFERRSAEIRQMLGAVKTEFGKFGDALSKVKKKIEEAHSSIDAAEVRTRAMARQLKGVEALPVNESQGLLGLDADEPPRDAAG